MPIRTLLRITALTILAAPAVPLRTAAQDNLSPNHKPKHHTYKLIDAGTLGGPVSYNYSENARVMNSGGIVTGNSDTSIPDPNNPAFNPLMLGAPDPLLQHAFLWSHGNTFDLGALPGPNVSGCDWVNDAGVVAGASTTGAFDSLNGWPAAEAVIWKHGQIIPLGDLGGQESLGIAINNREQVGGFGANAILDPLSFFGFKTQTRAFVWERGVMRDIGTLGGPDAAVIDMNDSGAVGASYTNSVPNPTTGIPTVDPFLWVNGRMTDLGTLGGTFGFPEWINSQRQVIGESNLAGDLVSHPFLWDEGVMRDLGTLGGDNGAAFFINEAGTIVGEADLPGSTVHHGYLWKRNVMSDLGTVGSDLCSNATHINARGQIVGTSTDCHRILRAFLWEDGEMVDLNSLVNPPSDAKILEPSYINDSGQITANAVLPSGDAHVVILIPNGNCDDDCDQRIGQSQVTQAVTPQSDARTANRVGPPLSPLERIRSMMRQRYHLPGQPAAPRE